MDIHDVLEEQRSGVLEEAFAALTRSHTAHYAAAGDAFTLERLGDLFDLVLAALRSRDLATVGVYCEDIAQRRFEAGFGISEVQTAFNTLEEAMWKQAIAAVPPEEVVEAIGLMSTILGFGKDALARRYVSLAAQRHVATLDLTEVFAGTDR